MLKSSLPVVETETHVEAAARPAAAPAGGVPPTVAQVAEEYRAFKVELERIEGELATRRRFLELEMSKLPGGLVPLADGQNALSLVVCESESIDVEAAKKKLGKKLAPFVQVIEKVDIKAARNYLGAQALEKFVSVKVTTQLRLKKLKTA